jgi:CIC family chloride channel protein
VLGNQLIEPEAFALVGMGAVFAGIVRAPVTSIIMIFEMTNNYSIILPLMIANITSYIVATEISPTPIYDALLRQDGIRLPHTERQHLANITVGDIMSREVATVSSDISAAKALEYLQALPANYRAYPITNDTDYLTGIISLNDLKRAIASGKDELPVGSLAGRNLITAYPDQTLNTALIKLGSRGISHLPVVSRSDEKRLIGIITIHDIAQALSRTEDPVSD